MWDINVPLGTHGVKGRLLLGDHQTEYRRLGMGASFLRRVLSLLYKRFYVQQFLISWLYVLFIVVLAFVLLQWVLLAK